MKKFLAMILLMVIAFAVASSDVKLNVSHNGSSNDTAGFSIYYGPSSRNYTNFQRFGYMTNVVVTNLPADSTLFFSGRAIDFNNYESDLGNEVQVATITPTNSLPSAVKDFRLMR